MQSSKRGFSVIGSLLGFSLLGLSTIGLATYMGSFEEMKVSYAQSANVQFMHSELLSSMEKILTMTNINTNSPSTANKKEYGLCAIVTDAANNNTYDRFKGKAICPIHLKASSINLASNYKDGSMERFKYFVQEGRNWTLSAGSCDKGAQENSQDINGFVDNFPDGDFHKCFKYQSKRGVDHIYARLSIEPQKMPAFKKVNSGSLLVDELAYKLKSVISVRKELESGEFAFSMSQSAKYLWAAEVLDCHICNSTECKLARFSSSGQGTAARHSKVCYHSMYAVKERKDALEMAVQKPTVGITGSYSSSTQKWTLSRQDSNASAVCRYNLFQCGGVSKRDKRNFDPALNFRFLLNYDQPEDSSIREFNLQVKDGSTTFSQGTLAAVAHRKAQVTRKKDGTLISFSEGDWPLKAGGNEVKAFMADQNSSGSSMCHQICDGSAPSFYPELTVKYGGSNCDGSSQCSKTHTFTEKVACYWCNAKSCHTPALSMYKSQKPSTAPIDGLGGDCLLASENSMSGLSGDHANIKTHASDLSDQSKKCLAKWKQLNLGTAAYALETCDDGTLASKKWRENRELQTIGVKGGDNVWSDGVLPSLSVAYNTTPDGVKTLLKNQKLPQTGDGKSYTFANYSQIPLIGHTFFKHYSMQRDASGMWHSIWQNVFYPEDMTDSTLTKEQKARWVYFYREPFKSIDFEDVSKVGGANTGDPPLPSGINRKNFLGRVRPARPIYIKMNDDFFPKESGSLVLVHHLAFKGITLGSADTVLCRNINADKYAKAFVTTTANGDGYTLCQDLGRNDWHFIPPDTVDLLSSALMAVAPNAPRYPFPNPFDFPDGIPFWTECTTGTDENGQACNSKMRRWKLSYKYEDLLNTAKTDSPDYKNSFGSDHEFFFDGRRGVLRSPASAYLGGLQAHASSPNFRQSWDYKPNWSRILTAKPSTPGARASYNPTRDPLEISPPSPHTHNSLLFNTSSSAANINTAFTDLEDDAKLSTSTGNIGAINYSGRIMTVRSLREAGDLSDFYHKSTKLCRYSKDENHIDFHKALIFVGKPDNWPATDDCADYTSSTSASFLATGNTGPDKIYYKISSDPGGDELNNPTGQDIVEIRKSIRSIVPLLKFHKKKGIYVRDTAKFCKAWKREKKRRAVGNCIIKNYNDDTLSIGGTNYGLSISQDARKANTCHPAGKNCSNTSNHFQGGYDALVNALDNAKTSKRTKEARKALIPGLISAQNSTCNQACSDLFRAYTNVGTTEYRESGGDTTRGFDQCACLACNDSMRPAWQTCRSSNSLQYCVDQDLDPCGCVAGGVVHNNVCGYWETNSVCTANKQAACNAIDALNAEKRRLTTEITNLTALITRLEGEKTTCTPLLTAAKNSSGCMTHVSTGSNFNKHTLSYSPSNGIVSCSSYITALPINFDDAGLDKKCWSVQKLNPEHSFSFDSLTGRVGINGRGRVWEWDADAQCISDTGKLHTLPARCSNKYTKPVDLNPSNNRFCDDGDESDYDNQTCVIP